MGTEHPSPLLAHFCDPKPTRRTGPSLTVDLTISFGSSDWAPSHLSKEGEMMTVFSSDKATDGALGKSPNFSVPQFSHLQYGEGDSIYLTGVQMD